MSVAIIEILLGAVAAYFGLKAEEWMLFIASFGGIMLTFLAGTEIDTDIMKKKLKPSLLIGGLSFLFPFIGIFLYAYLVAGWNLQASLIAGVALSTTSLAVVYSVLVETGLSKTEIGKLLYNQDFNQVSRRIFPCKKIYPKWEYVYNPLDEHRSNVWDNIKPVWFKCRTY